MPLVNSRARQVQKGFAERMDRCWEPEVPLTGRGSTAITLAVVERH